MVKYVFAKDEIRVRFPVSAPFCGAPGIEARLSYILSLRKNIANWGTEPVRFDSHLGHIKYFNPNVDTFGF